MSRSLRTLLRHILTEPAFLYSDTVIQAAGFPELPARTFFVRFEQITHRHLDQDRGFWGTVISYGYSTPRLPTRPPGDVSKPGGEHERGGQQVVGDVWLNAGPPQEPSVLIPSSQMHEFLDHNRLVSLDDVVGSRILVLGRCAESSRGKAYVRPRSPRHMTFLI